jgi:hypothetical protein
VLFIPPHRAGAGCVFDVSLRLFESRLHPEEPSSRRFVGRLHRFNGRMILRDAAMVEIDGRQQSDADIWGGWVFHAGDVGCEQRFAG